jgi:hypothetical protein
MVGDVSMAKHMRKAHPGTTVIVRDLFYKVFFFRLYRSYFLQDNLIFVLIFFYKTVNSILCVEDKLVLLINMS